MTALFLLLLTPLVLQSEPLDPPTVIQRVDAAVKARIDHVAGYTATEHYSVYRNKDEVHPVAEMTVRTTYRKDTGKSYKILSQSGSAIVRNLVLKKILDNEKTMTQPANEKQAWITSANYEMRLEAGGPRALDGRTCLVIHLTPKRKTPYLLEGVLWVDARDGSIVEVQGTAPESPSMFAGPSQVMRQYTEVSGYPEATHLRAVSDSRMFGRTIVTVDYTNYQIQLRPSP
jgi:hypothetical protein